eukprot:scaffold187591_cov27-Tisochrysis_lutea.AAC.2
MPSSTAPSEPPVEAIGLRMEVGEVAAALVRRARRRSAREPSAPTACSGAGATSAIVAPALSADGG